MNAGVVARRLLGLAYAVRRSLATREHLLALGARPDGTFAVEPGPRGLPHGWLGLELPDADWTAVEVSGRRWHPEGPRPWSSWVERSASGRGELDVPYRTTGLTLRVHPAGAVARTLRLRELGLVDTRRELLDAVLPASGDARSLGERLSEDLRYRRWLRAFDTPGPKALSMLRDEALASGLRLALLGRGLEPLRDAWEGQLPGRVTLASAARATTADVLVLAPDGGVPAPHALPLLAVTFARDPDVRLVHSDADRIDARGRRSRPSFLPSWSPERLLSQQYLSGLVALRRDLLGEGDLDSLDAPARLAFLLQRGTGLPPEARVRIPSVLVSRPESTYDGAEDSSVVEEFLRSTGTRARVEAGAARGLRRVRYPLPTSPPRVSIIVPTRNAGPLVDVCIRSVRARTRYPELDILLVDNGSDDPASLATFAALEREGLLRRHLDPRPFNYAALHDDAVPLTRGDVLCLLNNDIEALHDDWLEELVTLALRPGVGAVGAKLLYPDGRIQHGGVVIGIGRAADHAYAGEPGDAAGLDDALHVVREVSAVTAACLVVRREHWDAVGGMDAENFAVAFNDVDFCLKLRARGLRNLWTPHARLVHHESATRGRATTPEQRVRAERETAALQARWHTETFEDPYHSPNLALDSHRPVLAWPPRRRPWSAGLE